MPYPSGKDCQHLPPASPQKHSARTDSRYRQAHAAIKGAALSTVGSLDLIEAIRAFRREMVECALRQGNGSRRAAARLLGVTRPAIQSVLRRLTPSDE
jgi:transcriptional regulator with GAF, ATPase, and Fis domain